MSHTMAGYFQRIIDRHAESVTRGEHDDQCEWRDAGLYLCNCHARKRIASGFTTPPVLVYRDPICDQCGGEAVHDGDCFTCYTCHVHWPTNQFDEPGEFYDDNGPIDTSRWDGPS